MSRAKTIGYAFTVLVLASPIGYFAWEARSRAVAEQTATAGALPLSAPLPGRVPPGTTLVIGDPITQKVLEHNGWDRDLPFRIKWAHLSGGPAVTEAFHAKALDVGSAADIPPVHATWVGIPVKIIAVEVKQDPLNNPTWVMAVGPKAGIDSLDDLRGKRIAFSPGQVQGEVVLRTLQEHGLAKTDVTLVDMPSTSADVYINALIAGVIDAAPIANGVAARHYLANFGGAGGKLLRHGPFPDDLGDLYVRTETLQDPAKAAALRLYVQLWGRVQAWIRSHPEEWARVYWVGDQRLSPDDARYVVHVMGDRTVPRDWSAAIAQEQGAIDILARETGKRRFASTTLFDRRFEPVASKAFEAASANP